MIDNIKGGQTAFTWTGPFGSGKSSLALFLQGLVSDDKEIVEIASSKLSKKNKAAIVKHFNSEDQQWKTLNLTGQTIAPEQIFKEALNLESSASAKDILEALDNYVTKEQHLIIFIDELGKVFDGAAKYKLPGWRSSKSPNTVMGSAWFKPFSNLSLRALNPKASVSLVSPNILAA